ncbi:hypothetical protein SAMN00808754_1964 [Thermanaeromonas toyohensis ToBE]|uniref:Uncharacterized protein n=1 Tax=Thermanaeromonas toyohensis ToBE TaxID=698762 RepID=A0A1W1VXJ9_9FIRM|nr:hypothetical protein [Thermanaeromonas toyohensis]SMB97821.1 hypothetical protein SAMN00808754_1964 [Thermanaeromonas toyohensis ToBE]
MAKKYAPAPMPEWPFQVGDRIEVAERVGRDSKIQRYKGKITAITPAMLVVDTGKYRVTVLKGAWWSGAAVVKRL